MHVLDPYRGTDRPRTPRATALATLEETIELEGAADDRGVHPGDGHGDERHPDPAGRLPRGRARALHRHGIVLIADEIMCGFGRTGEWFAVNHWGVVPDLMTAAKGLTSSYLPLGAVAIKPEIAAHFEENVFYGGLTYNSHPLSCAAAIAAIQVLEEDDLVGNAKRLDPVDASPPRGADGEAPERGPRRNIGLFGILELVKIRETMEPLSPVQRRERDDAGGEQGAARARAVHDGPVQRRS